MRIGAIASANGNWLPAAGADRLSSEKNGALLKSEAGRDEKKVAPEQILDKIKSLTENGAHSVRFEMDDATRTLVVKIFDRNTEELIRQVPAEEILDLAKALQEYRGLFVDAKS